MMVNMIKESQNKHYPTFINTVRDMLQLMVTRRSLIFRQEVLAVAQIYNDLLYSVSYCMFIKYPGTRCDGVQAL